MTGEEKKRLKKALWALVRLLALGLCYAAFVRLTHWAIPCPFRLLTGRLCPGCGVTRMCLALLRGDFAAAYGYNRGLFLALPLLAVLLGLGLYQYVRGTTGTGKLGKLQQALGIGLIIYFLIWGLLRNRYGI